MTPQALGQYHPLICFYNPFHLYWEGKIWSTWTCFHPGQAGLMYLAHRTDAKKCIFRI